VPQNHARVADHGAAQGVAGAVAGGGEGTYEAASEAVAAPVGSRTPASGRLRKILCGDAGA
jgi:hypothetical protein